MGYKFIRKIVFKIINNLNDFKHNLEVELLCKYSPFKTREELLSQFDKISGPSGTLVCVYNLKLNVHGESEFEFTEDDILMNELSQFYVSY